MKLSSVNEKDFCSEFGIAFSDVENKLFKTEPNPCRYFNKNGIKSGCLTIRWPERCLV